MATIFISHSHQDNAAAIAVGRWLSDNGWGDFFLDISPDRGLSPGERWQEALKQAADRCEAVVFLVSDDWLQSRWCLAEFLLAKQLGKVIFGVLIAPVPLDRLPTEMRNEWQLCDLVAGDERADFRIRLEDSSRDMDVTFAAAGLLRLRRGLERAGLAASTFPWPPPTDPGRVPYSGLRALDREDAAVFFGRDAPITSTLDTLRRVRESGVERLFVILGASGSGKSSFLRAGVLPRLARDDRQFFVTPVVRPERAALFGPTGLLNAIEGAFRAAKVPKTRAALREALRSADAFSLVIGELREAVHVRLGGQSWPTIVFSIDQAEELFGAEHRGESERLLELLQRTMEPAETGPVTPAVFTLISIRSDSYEQLQTARFMAAVKQHVISLLPMPREEYKTIIEGPAARHVAAGHRLRVDPKLTAQLLEDAEGADALPLMAFTLERLFVEHGGDGELSLDDYVAIGGIEGAIEAAVKAALADPAANPAIPSGEAELHRQLRDAFIPWLARVDAETEERKRRVASWDEIPRESRPVLERLIAQRLLVRDRRRIPGSSTDSIVVELAHEALLRRWTMLTLWLDQDADALKTIDIAKRAAAEWAKHGRRDAWLNHAAERLAVVEMVLQRADLDRLLGDEGWTYIHACRARENAAAAEALARERARQETEHRALQAEQAAERERLRLAKAEATQASERAEAARRLSRRTLLGAGIAVAFMIAAIWAAVSARDQQRAAEHALGTLNVAQAARELEGGLVPEAVAHLAEAVRLEPDEPVWRASLISALISNRWARVAADIQTPEPATSAIFSPDGLRVLVASGDEARLWDASTGLKACPPLRHRNMVLAAQFSPDGRLIVTASQDRTARVWDGQTGAPRTDPIHHAATVTDAHFAVDGRRLLTTAAGVRRLLDAVSGADISAGVEDFSSSGRYGIGRQGRQIVLWDVRSRQPLGAIETERSDALAFSADESVAAIASGALIAIVNTGTRASARAAMPEQIRGLAISADNRFVAAWGYRVVGAFDVRSGALAGPFISVPGITSVQLQSDGSRLLSTAVSDGSTTASVWNVADGRNILPSQPAQLGALCGASVVITVRSNSLSVWHAATGGTVGQPIAHEAPVQLVAFSADCRLGASVAGREVRTWDPLTGTPVTQPLIHSSPVTGIAFSPDDGRVVTVSAGGARVWDLRAAQARAQSLQHPAEYERIAFSANGARVATAAGKEVRTWNANDGTPAGPALATEDVSSIEISPHGDRILVTGSHASVYDITSGKLVGRPFGLVETYSGATTGVMSPDWSVLVTITGKAARIWRVDSGARHGKLLAHRQAIRHVGFSRDGSTIVTTSSDGSARLWSAATGLPLAAPMRHEQTVRDAVFSANGSRVATVFDRLVSAGDVSVPHPLEVRVWDVRTGAAVGQTIAHDEDVTAVALSPDGTRLLTGHGNIAELWDPAQSSRVGTAIDLPQPVTSALFSLDGRRIVIAAGDAVNLFDAERFAAVGGPVRFEGTVRRAQFVPGEQRLLVTTAMTEGDPRAGDCRSDDCGLSGWMLDAPTAATADVPALTKVAEFLGGYRVSALGALEPVQARAAAAAFLLHTLREGKSQQRTDGQRIVLWLLSEPSSREVAPLASPSTASIGASDARR